MSPVYQIADRKDSRALSQYLAQNGQLLLPMVELISSAQVAVEEFMDVLGRAALEAVLELSAAQVAGPRHQGRPGGEVRRHGTQGGVVSLSTQKVRVRKPRLRRKGGGQAAEVPIPAYEAMQDDTSLQAKLSDILMSGVSTRKYERVIPEMAESCGVSKSSVSR
ncbi:MAG: transposase, partial [Armatimonadetes bacterium]|nr:transposase [Armatimonadota bacterium]